MPHYTIYIDDSYASTFFASSARYAVFNFCIASIHITAARLRGARVNTCVLRLLAKLCDPLYL